jgi:hypothetical protein
MARIFSFLSILAILGVLFVLFSCSFSPSPSTSENTNNSSTSGGGSIVYDTNGPTVAIVSPTNGQEFYDNAISVSGTANDIGSGVKEVRLSLDNGQFNLVNGTTNWSTNITVDYGNHTISVYAVDYSNNVSETNSVSFVVVKAIYVSTSGNDVNDGLLPSTPVRTLVRAIEIANTIDSTTNVLIKVGSGLYTPGSGLSNANVGLVINRPNVIISGGWNSDFTSVIDKSEFDGNNTLYHIIKIENVTNVIYLKI